MFTKLKWKVHDTHQVGQTIVTKLQVVLIAGRAQGRYCNIAKGVHGGRDELNHSICNRVFI